MECEAEGGMVIRGGWEREEAVEVLMCMVGEVEVGEEIELVVV